MLKKYDSIKNYQEGEVVRCKRRGILMRVEMILSSGKVKVTPVETNSGYRLEHIKNIKKASKLERRLYETDVIDYIY